MTWLPWNLPNFRGDPNRTEAVGRGHQVFAWNPPHRHLVALIDYDLVRASGQNPKLIYLLQLVSDNLIDASLWDAEGPAAGARLHWISGKAGNKIDAYKDWVDVRPAMRSDQRLFAWFKDGKPFHRVMGLSDFAYERVMTASPPPEYGATGNADRLKNSDAMAMLAAKAIGADIFVTERKLPHLLGQDEWSRVTVISPADALPLVGLYLRSQRRFVITQLPMIGKSFTEPSSYVQNSYEFYWWAAEALLPELERWRIACRDSSAAMGDDMLESLQETVVQRLKQALQSRDRLLARLAVPQDWDTADDVLGELEQLLICIMGGFDATARVAHIALGYPAREIRFASWSNEQWVRDVKKNSVTLGALVTGCSDGKWLFEILAPLRNLIHGAPISSKTVILVVGDHALETWVPIPTADRMKILNAMRELGGLDVWGIRYPLKRAGSHSRAQRDDPFLHPGIFIETLLPHAISMLNQILKAVPVEQLSESSISSSSLPSRLPISTAEERTLWQLGIGRKST